MIRLADVAVLARDVIAKHKCRFGSIRIPVNVVNSGLLDIVSDVTKLKIELSCLPWQGNMFRGRLQRYSQSAKIWYSTELNVCWSRFVICKEAFHLLCGDEKNYSSDPVTLVNGLLTSTPIGIDGEQDAEQLAMYGAMELLVPANFDSELYSMEANGKTHYEIAYKFRVPEKIIAFRLSPGVRTTMDTLHNEMR